MGRVLFVAVVACLGVGTAQANDDSFSARWLQETCREYEDAIASGKAQSSFNVGACIAFVKGAVDGMQVAVVFTTDKAAYCAPKAVTTDQIIKVVKRTLDSRPEKLHHPAAVIVWQAITEAFPCSSKTGER